MTPHSDSAHPLRSAEAQQQVRPVASGRVRAGWLGLGLLLAAGVFWLVRARMAADAADKPKPRERVPLVQVLTLQPRDVPLLLEGLGTVTPLSTVTIKPQVDGRLLSIDFKEGGAVRRGQLLAQIDPRPFRIKLAQARASVARDRAQLHNAERDLERYRSLRDRKLISQQQLDAQESQVAQLTAARDADQAAADQAALQLEYARITSPIDGVAGIRQVDPGNLVRASDAGGIVVLTQLDPIAVVFTLPQDDLPRVAAALAAGPRKVSALSRGGDRVLARGQLTVIDNQVNQATGSVRLKAVFDNPEHALWPNQFVRARLQLDTERGVLVVPAAALRQGPSGTFVYIVDRDMRAQMRPVEVGALQREDALIASGLRVGERVVIEGQDLLKPKVQVQLRQPAEHGRAAAGGPADGP